jgi:hypothetical protein
VTLTRRDLRWDGCLNVRDLGGLPLECGGETRFRIVIRADSLRDLTEKGREAFLAAGVRRIVDLRSDPERADDELGNDRTPPTMR